MVNRQELKGRGKAALKRNYWKTVLVGLIVTLLVGGTAAGGSLTKGLGTIDSGDESSSSYVTYGDGPISGWDEGGSGRVTVDGHDGQDLTVDYRSDHGRTVTRDELDGTTFGLHPFELALAGNVVLVIVAVSVALMAFLALPLEVGCRRFLLVNLNRKAEVREVPWAFDNSYLNVVKVMFLRGLKLLGWTLLLVVPGIVKFYEYRMIPYLLAEDPGMDMDQAFAESRRLMDGNKWEAFVLDLSFLGWNLLSALTLGLMGAFYAGPYQEETNAALYEALRYGGSGPVAGLPVPGGMPTTGDPMGGAPADGGPQAWAPVTNGPVPPASQVLGGPVPPTVVGPTAPTAPSAPAPNNQDVGSADVIETSILLSEVEAGEAEAPAAGQPPVGTNENGTAGVR